MEKRTAEKIIVFVYSVYAVALMFATTILDWPGWITPITSVEVVAVWIVYLREVKDYRFRALLYSAVVLATFALYNTQENSFGGILTTYCAAIVVLSILDIPEIVIPEYVCSALLVAYHWFFGGIIPHATAQERIRSAVQILSVFAVVGITHHLIKKHEAANRHMQEMIEELKEAEQSKVDLLANAAHEFRIPVNAICGTVGELLQEELPDRARENALDIQTAGQDLLSMVSGVLDYSALESGRMPLTEKPYHLAATIHDVLDMADACRGEKDLELIVDCDAKLPHTLLGDEPKLRRVIWNFVSNAVKFTAAGCVTIVIYARPEQYGVNLCVKVRDTGPGIAGEKLETLFGGLHRIDVSDGRRPGGIGIGLAVAKKLVHIMKGFVSVKSELGKGSEFQFVVPQRVVNARPMAEVRDAEDMNLLFCINTEKASFTEIRDNYMNSICHMLEGLEVRYHLCRNLGELRRRTDQTGYTHALITQDEYLEDPAYFDKLSKRLKIIMIQNRDAALVPGESIETLQKPFYALSLAEILNGVRAPRRAERPEAPRTGPKANIDRGKGIRNMGGNPEDYEEVLQVFWSEGQEMLRELQTRYQAEDWKNYVIFVHSLKSNSFGIGADGLGEMAKAMEAAVKEENVEYVRARHAELMRFYGEVLSEIRAEADGARPEAEPAAPAEGREHV